MDASNVRAISKSLSLMEESPPAAQVKASFFTASDPSCSSL